MKSTEPFTERVMQGLPFFTAKSQDDQRGSFLSCYGLVGHGGAVFIVTVEGWLKNKSTAEVAVEGMIKNIVWKKPSHSHIPGLLGQETTVSSQGIQMPRQQDFASRRLASLTVIALLLGGCGGVALGPEEFRSQMANIGSVER